jgi:hypothetical protein
MPAGAKTAELRRKYKISGATFYKLSVSEAKRLRALESENVRLKKLVADAMFGDPPTWVRACMRHRFSKLWCWPV